MLVRLPVPLMVSITYVLLNDFGNRIEEGGAASSHADCLGHE